LRVCLLVNEFPVVSQTFVVNHAAGLLARDHEVVVVPIQERRASSDLAWTPEVAEVIRRSQSAATGVTPRRAAALRFSLGRQGFAARGVGPRWSCATRVSRAAPFDVLHAHFGPSGVVAVALRDAGAFDAPIVCSFHGYDANVIARQWPGCYDGMVGNVEQVTAGTSFMRGVIEDLGFAAEDITVWPQGVDTDRIALRAASRDTRDAFHALSVARLVDFKGVDVSIRAVAAARSRIAGLHYTIIGDGERGGDLQRLAKELGVDDIVTFAGPRSHDEVLAAFADADVFLLTGRVDGDGQKEGQGVAPLEASASGVPVIATRVGGLTEVVLDGETGLVIEPEDSAAAAAALVRLAGDAALRTELGTRGRAHVERSFSQAQSLDVITGLYARIAGTAA
jgi:colanic acid/amylovoran biosynthesis glycosyltransferase